MKADDILYSPIIEKPVGRVLGKNEVLAPGTYWVKVNPETWEVTILSKYVNAFNYEANGLMNYTGEI